MLVEYASENTIIFTVQIKSILISGRPTVIYSYHNHDNDILLY